MRISHGQQIRWPRVNAPLLSGRSAGHADPRSFPGPGDHRVLFYPDNLETLRRHNTVSTHRVLALHHSFAVETLAILAGLAGHRIDPSARVEIFPLVFETTLPYHPFGWTISRGSHHAYVEINEALLYRDSIRELRKRGYSNEAIRYFFRNLNDDLKKLIFRQQVGKIDLRVILDQVLTHELAHAVHLLFDHRLGRLNASEKLVTTEGQPASPTRLRVILAEAAALFAEDLIGDQHSLPRFFRQKSDAQFFDARPPLTHVDLHWLDRVDPYMSDFDSGWLLSKDLLSMTLHENAHTIANLINQKLISQLSFWYLVGRVRDPAQVKGVLRLWHLYFMLSKPERNDLIHGSEKEKMLKETDMALLILSISYALINSDLGEGFARRQAELTEYSPLPLFVIWLKEKVKTELRKLLREYEQLAGRDKYQELRNAIDNSKQFDLEMKILQETGELRCSALYKVADEIANIATPDDLVKLVSEKIDETIIFLKTQSSVRTQVVAELEILRGSVRGEDFGRGNNMDNYIFKQLFEAWRKIASHDEYMRISREKGDEGYCREGSARRQSVFLAAEALNGLREEEVPGYSLITLA